MQEEISFGTWLRKQRRALDLSRQAFADRVGCAEVTLRRIEAGMLKPSKELANVLLEKLGIPESERLRWISFARGLSGFPTQLHPPSNKVITNLPALLTTFIGREKEQSDVVRLMGKHRLLTLTGPGGVGKTRLAIKVGERVLGDYADGVWLVELAPLLDPTFVPRTTAIAVGLRDEPRRPVIDMLADYFREKRLLVILDNCEHLLEACAQLVDVLLKRCPTLKILATAREALGILGEAVYNVPPLELPNLQQLVEKFRDYESVRLFEERAQLVRVDFSLTLENASAVSKICTHLDGMPLAIELAAARITTFSPAQIEERLQKRFSLLTTGNRTALPRHQTLRATIDWSYDLLSPAEQTLFRRLSVFVNGWTLEAAQSVCSDVIIIPEVISELLTKLISKSLVITEEIGDKLRHHMLETIRQYANEKLVESGESDELRDRHLEYFLNLAETAEPHLFQHEQLDWLPVLDTDYENLRFALEWSLSKKTAESSLNFCKALWWFWRIRCYWLEGLGFVKRSLAKPSQNESMNEKAARSRALITYADLEWQLGNFEKSLPPAQASLELASEVSNKRDIAIAKFYLAGALMLRGGDDDQARFMLEQSLADFQELNDIFWQTQAFGQLGSWFVRQGKLNWADVLPKILELARQTGERLTLANALFGSARFLLDSNRVNEAKELAEESDRLFKQIGAENTSENSLLFAQMVWLNGEYHKARTLYLEIQERFSLLGDKYIITICQGNLGILAMEQGNLTQAQLDLQQALILAQQLEYKPVIANCLIELSKLSYMQEELDAFKRYVRESLALRNFFPEFQKPYILLTILTSMYSLKPEIAAQLLGVIDSYEKRSDDRFRPVEQRYYAHAHADTRGALSSTIFESALAEGQKMSLDEGLDLALKTIEEI